MYASIIDRTGWTLEYISEVPCVEAIKILGEAWEEESLEAQGIKKNKNIPSMNQSPGIAIDPVSMPNVWDGEKEGNTRNAEVFNRMLMGTK